MIEVLTCKETVVRKTIKLTGTQIVSLLRGAKVVGKKVPNEATVRFNVPTGGDWSGTEIFIDSENAVWVTWEEKNVEDTRETL